MSRTMKSRKSCSMLYYTTITILYCTDSSSSWFGCLLQGWWSDWTASSSTTIVASDCQLSVLLFIKEEKKPSLSGSHTVLPLGNKTHGKNSRPPVNFRHHQVGFNLPCLKDIFVVLQLQFCSIKKDPTMCSSTLYGPCCWLNWRLGSKIRWIKERQRRNKK